MIEVQEEKQTLNNNTFVRDVSPWIYKMCAQTNTCILFYSSVQARFTRMRYGKHTYYKALHSTCSSVFSHSKRSHLGSLIQDKNNIIYAHHRLADAIKAAFFINEATVFYFEISHLLMKAPQFLVNKKYCQVVIGNQVSTVDPVHRRSLQNGKKVKLLTENGIISLIAQEIWYRYICVCRNRNRNCYVLIKTYLLDDDRIRTDDLCKYRHSALPTELSS